MQKPLIYFYEEEILHFFSEGNNQTRGVAFEWRNENVFHVHTSTPKIPVSGFPCMSFIFRVSDTIFHLTNMEILEHVDAYNLVAQKSSFSQKALLSFFTEKDGMVLKKTLLLEDTTVIDCESRYVPQKSELYSRSKGLLETGVLENKKVAIVGLGSFGSNIAIELAKSGIGHFVLFDFDRIELSNIARHICGINDLGRYKTHAIRDAILLKNPFAIVSTFEININENRAEFQNQIQHCDLVLCLTDENRSREFINNLSINLKKPVIYGRAITRAEGGDVFKYTPQAENPCLACLIGKGLFTYKEDEISNRKQLERDLPAYTSFEENEATIQVGLSSDILPICNMIVKLTLLELSRGLNTGLSSLEEDLVADYYIWANRREKKYKNWEKLAHKANQLSILRWYGVRVPKDAGCLTCGG
jgi:molybdopterin/thiamine biosynthesis adenylyltransferase